MSPNDIARDSRPYDHICRHPKYLLKLGCALVLFLLAWVGNFPSLFGGTAEAALLSDTHLSTISITPQGAGRTLPPTMQFEPNLGHTDAQVRFMAQGAGYTVFLTPSEAVLVLPTGTPHSHAGALPPSEKAGGTQVLRLQVLGGNPTPHIHGVHKSPTTRHRLVGTDPTQWQTQIPVYTHVRYDAMYPGIDLLYYGNHHQLEYDFIVHPGADPTAIILGIEGATHAELEADGHLRLSLPDGLLRLQKPVLSQTVAGHTTEIPGHFLLLEPQPNDPTAPAIQVAFAVGPYDRTRPLIIDPLVNYASAFGGEGADQGEAIAVDDAGHGYIVGTTDSFRFPVTAEAFQESAIGADRDVFVTKFDTATSEILFSTYIGGEGHDRATGVAVDAAGIPYVTGETTSLTFPTQHRGASNALQGVSDTFVLKLATGWGKSVCTVLI